MSDEALVYERRSITTTLQCGPSASVQARLEDRRRLIDRELADRRDNIRAAEERVAERSRPRRVGSINVAGIVLEVWHQPGRHVHLQYGTTNIPLSLAQAEQLKNLLEEADSSA